MRPYNLIKDIFHERLINGHHIDIYDIFVNAIFIDSLKDANFNDIMSVKQKFIDSLSSKIKEFKYCINIKFFSLILDRYGIRLDFRYPNIQLFDSIFLYYGESILRSLSVMPINFHALYASYTDIYLNDRLFDITKILNEDSISEFISWVDYKIDTNDINTEMKEYSIPEVSRLFIPLSNDVDIEEILTGKVFHPGIYFTRTKYRDIVNLGDFIHSDMEFEKYSNEVLYSIYQNYSFHPFIDKGYLFNEVIRRQNDALQNTMRTGAMSHVMNRDTSNGLRESGRKYNRAEKSMFSPTSNLFKKTSVPQIKINNREKRNSTKSVTEILYDIYGKI